MLQSNETQPAATLPAVPVYERVYDNTNPLYDRLNRLARKRRRWWILALIVGFVLGAGQYFPLLLYTLQGIRNATTYYYSLAQLGLVASFVGALISFFSPVILAGLSSLLTTRFTTADTYELILLTDLSNVQIVRAYLRAAFKRSRALLALQLGLTLSPVIMSVVIIPLFYHVPLTYSTYALNGVSGVMSILFVAVRLPWDALGLVFGVWLGQRRTSAIGAVGSAVVSLFVAEVIYSAATTYLQLRYLFSDAYRNYNAYSNAQLLTPAALGYMLITLGVTVLVPLAVWVFYKTLPSRVRRL